MSGNPGSTRAPGRIPRLIDPFAGITRKRKASGPGYRTFMDRTARAGCPPVARPDPGGARAGRRRSAPSGRSDRIPKSPGVPGPLLSWGRPKPGERPRVARSIGRVSEPRDKPWHASSSRRSRSRCMPANRASSWPARSRWAGPSRGRRRSSGRSPMRRSRSSTPAAISGMRAGSSRSATRCSASRSNGSCRPRNWPRSSPCI